MPTNPILANDKIEILFNKIVGVSTTLPDGSIPQLPSVNANPLTPPTAKK
jgi:hypothetical protein